MSYKDLWFDQYERRLLELEVERPDLSDDKRSDLAAEFASEAAFDILADEADNLRKRAKEQS